MRSSTPNEPDKTKSEVLVQESAKLVLNLLKPAKTPDKKETPIVSFYIPRQRLPPPTAKGTKLTTKKPAVRILSKVGASKLSFNRVNMRFLVQLRRKWEKIQSLDNLSDWLSLLQLDNVVLVNLKIIQYRHHFTGLVSNMNSFTYCSDLFEVLAIMASSKFEYMKLDVMRDVASAEFISKLDSLIDLVSLHPPKRSELDFFLRNLATIYGNLFIQLDSLINDDFTSELESVVQKCLLLCQHTEQTEIADGLNGLLAIISAKDVLIRADSCYPYNILQEESVESNIIKGPFDSFDQYLSIHYRLLKEDFQDSLRVGIGDYLKSLHGRKRKSAFDLIFVYHEVILSTEVTDLRLKYKITFTRASEIDKVQGNKTFCNGSLLLLTYPERPFAEYFLAKVEDSSPLDNKKKFIFVSIVLGPPDLMLKEYNGLLMVEPAKFFEPYYRVLQVIRSIEGNNFPFLRYLVDVKTDVSPPYYVDRDTVFKIDGFSVPLWDDEKWPLPEQIGLNLLQLEGLKLTLRSELAIIQGPPGTGKTYLSRKVIEVLLDNKHLWHNQSCDGVGMILVVCYKNQSLDQLLGGLVKKKRKVVRLGLQSKDENLDEYNLRSLDNPKCTPYYFLTRRALREEQEGHIIALKHSLGMVKSIDSFDGLIKFDVLLPALSLAEDDLDFLQGNLEKWLLDCSECQFCNASDVKSLLAESASCWADAVEEEMEVESNFSLLTFHDLNELVGRVTAKIDALKDLESQTEDFIAKLKSAVKFLLDKFDLLQELMKFVSQPLTEKERSHVEEINDSVESSNRILENLLMDDRRLLYKSWVSDLRKFNVNRIAWLENRIQECMQRHSELQEMQDLEKLAQCDAEVIGMTTTAAAKNYKTLHYLKPRIDTNGGFQEKDKHPSLHGVQFATVDSFQGKENDIILLSLVRSNNFGSIGFVGMKNRINVALSRARIGLFITGNSKLLSMKNGLWPEVLNLLKSDKSVGRSIPLKCQVHGKITELAKPQDFSKVANGGCSRICNQLLDCNHECKRQCHPVDRDHVNLYKCQSPCGKPMLCLHMCDRSCHFLEGWRKCLCLRCSAGVKCNEMLPCRHRCEAEAHVDDPDHRNKYQCNKICDTMLNCGHVCRSMCHTEDPNHQHNYKCPIPCEGTLLCGHPCQIKSTQKHECFTHSKTCCKLCDKELSCGHRCHRFAHLGDRLHKNLYAKCIKCTDEENLGPSPTLALQSSQSASKTVVQPEEPPRMSELCRVALKCGHTCDRKVGHESDLDHTDLCVKPCHNKMSCGHMCRKACHPNTRSLDSGNVCDSCKAPKPAIVQKVEKVVFKQKKAKCGFTFDCGLHSCLKKKHCEISEHNTICRYIRTIRFQCGHAVSYRCFQASKLESTMKCDECSVGSPNVCGFELDCGHICAKTAGHSIDKLHSRMCRRKEPLKLKCGHSVPLFCPRPAGTVVQCPECETKVQPQTQVLPAGRCGFMFEKCRHLCEKLANHKATHKNCKIVCTVNMDCGHVEKLKCWRVDRSDRTACCRCHLEKPKSNGPEQSNIRSDLTAKFWNSSGAHASPLIQFVSKVLVEDGMKASHNECRHGVLPLLGLCLRRCGAFYLCKHECTLVCGHSVDPDHLGHCLNCIATGVASPFPPVASKPQDDSASPVEVKRDPCAATYSCGHVCQSSCEELKDPEHSGVCRQCLDERYFSEDELSEHSEQTQNDDATAQEPEKSPITEETSPNKKEGKCLREYPCSHTCNRISGHKGSHGSCPYICRKKLPCDHECIRKCHYTKNANIHVCEEACGLQDDKLSGN
ncbi:unnamed protein product [Nesidiocoris tenuis]|uniref:NF-X1-type domain-containing protein n=1 Tax=Nesidiocoris tenuis TaxID=355587 RepID=A0A6H5GTZ5_9HEMI|nr:unnamed protein product [Nesidiocoris tenuis]